MRGKHRVIVSTKRLKYDFIKIEEFAGEIQKTDNKMQGIEIYG